MWLLELPLCLTLHFYHTSLLRAHRYFGLSCPTVISWVSFAAAGLAAGPLHHSAGALWPSGPGSRRRENLGCRQPQITSRGAGHAGALSAWGLICQYLMLTEAGAKWALHSRLSPLREHTRLSDKVPWSPGMWQAWGPSVRDTFLHSRLKHARFISTAFCIVESQNFGSGGALGDSLSTALVRKWGTSLCFTTKSAAPEAIFLESQFKLFHVPPLGLSEEVQDTSTHSWIQLCSCGPFCPECLLSLPHSQLPLGMQLVILRAYVTWKLWEGRVLVPLTAHNPAHWQNEMHTQ